MQTNPQGQPESFTCPDCGMVSHNQNDIAHGYCCRCHSFPEQREAADRIIDAFRDYGETAMQADKAFRELADVSRRSGPVLLSPWQRFRYKMHGVVQKFFKGD